MPKGVRCVVRTVPVPLQSGQTSGVVPGAQPVPLQSAHFSTRPTVTSFLQPKAASSKEMFTLARRFSPRRGALGFVRVPPKPPPKPPPKKLEKMSPRSPKSPKPSKPAPPKPSKPAPPKPALGSKAAWPYWSYFARLSSSERIS